jgi:hypothetical protein
VPASLLRPAAFEQLDSAVIGALTSFRTVENAHPAVQVGIFMHEIAVIEHNRDVRSGSCIVD